MTKKHLIKLVLLCIFLCQFFTRASAQYATSGTAGTNLINSVYWLTWDNATLAPTSPTKVNGGSVTNGVYQWLFSPTVRITATVTNLVVAAPTGIMQPYTSGTFYGDGLNQMFTANGSTGVSARAVPNSGISVANGTANFDIAIKMELFINNTWTEVNYPGMVIADAESIDHGTGADDPADANYLANREYIQATSPSTVEWQVLSKIYPGYPAAPGPDAQYYRMTKTHTATSQTFKFQVQKFGVDNAGVQAVSYARGVKQLNNVTMLGSGITAMAIGFVVPFDLGDGPASYGVSGSYINDFVEVDQTTGDGDFQLATFTPVSLTPKATVYIGAPNVDADGQAMSGALANNDDLVGDDDEATLNPATLPDIKVNQNATVALTVPVTNNEATAATLYGWIDFNDDGVFSADELVTIPVPAGFSGNVTLNFPSSMYTGKIKTGLLYTRLRITTSALIDDPATPNVDERSFGFSANGESEDYKLKDVIGLTISGTVYDDGNGVTGGIASTVPTVTTGIGFVSGDGLDAYLVDKTTNLVVAKVTVANDGTYAFTNVNSGNYIVAISTNDVPVGSTLAAVTANLPANWLPSAGSYGTNNAFNTGLTPLTNLQIDVTTPANALDVSGVSFGINQVPATIADNATTNIGQAVTVAAAFNDFDPDGGKVLTSLKLIDPADNTEKTTVTVAGKGTYVVDPVSGDVTFTPIATFVGKATITYTILDDAGAKSLPGLITINVKPVGVNDSGITAVGTPVTTNVKANDGPSGAATVTVTATNGANGTTTVDAATGNVIYTPTGAFTGTDTYTYVLTTADGVASDPITVTITVNPIPVGVADNVTTPINVPVTTTVTANDGPDGVGSTVASATLPTHGTIVVNADGTIAYTPTADYIGKDTYTYTLTKGGVTSAPVTVTVNIQPVGVNDATTTPVNVPVATTVKTNDGPSGTGTIVTPTNGAHGTTVADAAGVVTFTPAAGYAGNDTYTYTLTTADGVVSAPITVTVTIVPAGVADVTSTPINTPVATNVKANDGPSGIGTTVTPTNGTHGTTTVDAAGVVTYTPANNYVGKDTYTYTLTTTDGVVSAPITVTVNVKPTGAPDNISTPINTPLTTAVNTNDGPGATGATITATNGAHGTTTVDAAGNITYTPATNYMGKDTYTYTLTTPDGVVSDPITVTVSVKPVGVNDAVTTPVNTQVNTTVKANDGISATGTTVTPTTAANGTTTSNPAGVVTYTPATGYVGIDTYTYTLTTADGVVSDPITVTVTIKPVGVNDAAVTNVNTPVTTAVTANDGAAATGATVTPANGAHGTTTVDAAGNVTYTPASGYTGKDTYTYTLTTNGAVSDPITVTVSIKPVGTPDVISTPRSTPVTTAVKTNDGPGSATSTVTATNGAHGTTTVDAAGNVIYTPAAGFTGTDTYTYTLTTPDGVVSDPITVTVNITPIGLPDAATTPINTPVTTNVTANDGPSAVGATVTAGNGAHGTTTVDAAGRVTYTPSPEFVGVDTYTYTLTSNGTTSAPITVTVNVKPVGTPDVLTTTINTPLTYTVAVNDGPSGVGATVAPTNGTHGTTTVDATGKVTYTPASGYTGVDTYTYTLTNGGVTSDPVTVIVYVKPVGTPDVTTTPVNTPVTTTVKANDGASGVGTTVTATNGAHGTTTVDAAGRVTYTPAAGYTGKDTYTYTLTTADNVVSDPITVTVNVAPAGLPDTDTTPMNTPVITTVKANDGTANAAATVTPTNGAHGTTTVDAAGRVTYTPATGYSGIDTYTYTLTTADGVVSAPILVTITVKPVGVPDTDQTPVNTAVTTAVKNNDGAAGTGATVIATNGAHGTTTVTVGGSVIYTPANGYIGTDTYTYTLTTGGVTSDPITVTINVYGASVSLTKVASNTVSKAGDVINYTLVVKNTGTAILTNVTVTDAGADAGSISPANIASLAVGASVTVTAKHTLTQANVDAGGYSNQATVTGADPKGNAVTSISDDPNTPAVNDATVVTIAPAGAMTITKTGVFTANNIVYTFVIRNTGNINLTNITLTDSKLGLTNIAITLTGGVLIPGATVTYTAPAYTLTQADKDAGTVTNSATAVAQDNKGAIVSGSASTTTTVAKSPTAVDDHATTKPNQPVIISILTNDNSGNSTFNTTTIEIVTQPAHGTVTINSDGTVTYTPAAGYIGNDSFTYRVKDAFGYYTNVATATIIDDFIPEIKVPTLFTPNGDGNNDTFEIRNLNLYAQNELLIVNRWGNEVFKQTSYQNGWTGEGLNEGTYYYILRLKKTSSSDWEVIKGYVTLIRTFKK